MLSFPILQWVPLGPMAHVTLVTTKRQCFCPFFQFYYLIQVGINSKKIKVNLATNFLNESKKNLKHLSILFATLLKLATKL
jgi:hypothetical protein